jgi:NDP-sugar pyrophosphorylase family protein
MVVMAAILPRAGDGRPNDVRPADVCAAVLAAGEGARLRPLTRLRPKALCPVGDVPLVDLGLARAASVVDPGAVAVNASHGRAALEAHLAGRAHVSAEPTDEPGLGTAGALAWMRDWIAGRGVLVLNADTWAPGDLGPFVAGWDRTRVRILVAGDDRLRPPDRPTSPIVAACMPWPEVARLAPVPSGLWEVSWRDRMAEGAVEVVRWDGPFIDCGTPARYLAANLAANGGAPVVGAGAEVTGTLARSVVWPGARVNRGEHLVDAIRADDGMTVLVR